MRYLWVLIMTALISLGVSASVWAANWNLNASEDKIASGTVLVTTSAKPAPALPQCLELERPSFRGNVLDAEWFNKEIDFFSKNTKDFEILFSARDEAYRSSESDILRHEAIISQLLFFQTAFFQYPTNQRATDLKKILFKLFETKFMSKLDKKDHEPRYSLSHFLAIALHSFDVLRARKMFTKGEEETFEKELKYRFGLLEKGGKPEWFYGRQCKPGIWLKGKNCANHTYYEHYIRTLYGFIFNEDKHFVAGERMFKFAIDDAKRDIGLWREASRGPWAWQYYSVGLTDLAGIAEVYRRRGIDLYSYKSDLSGLSYHDLVDLFLLTINDHEVMYKYASKNWGLKGRESDLRDLTMFQKVVGPFFPERSNWFYLYKGRFPEREAVVEYEKLVPSLKTLASRHFNLGFNPQCNHAETSISNKIREENDIPDYKNAIKNRTGDGKHKTAAEEAQSAMKKRSAKIMAELAKNKLKEQTTKAENQIDVQSIKFRSTNAKMLDDRDKYLSFRVVLAKESDNTTGPNVNSFKVMVDLGGEQQKKNGKPSQIRIEIDSLEYLDPTKTNKALICKKSTIKKKGDTLIAYRLYSGAGQENNECALSTMTEAGRKEAESLLATLGQIFANDNVKKSDPYGVLEKHSQFLMGAAGN